MTSPLTRCVETAVNIASQVGITQLQTEPALVETICLKWYRSWAFKGISDSRWDGPAGFDWTKVNSDDPSTRHAASSLPASHMYHGEEELTTIVANTNKIANTKVTLNS